MRSLFIFLYKFRAFISLVLLETVCGILIIQNSQYHRALFFNSSNATIGAVLTTSSNVTQYFRLHDINESLAAENAALKNSLNRFERLPDSLKYDSTRRFNYINARVINNSVDMRNNTITIDVGKNHGVKKDMGVIANGSIVGKTRYVSNNYTVVTSLLHTETMVSATIKNKVEICTVQWDGVNPYQVDLLYVPRHYNINIGDTVVSNGYTDIFPEGIMIGTIDAINLSEDAPFYNIQVALTTDFYKIAFVEVAESIERPEIDSLQNLAQ